MTRFLDTTRLVIDNDGWEHVSSDIYGYHDYSATRESLTAVYKAMLAHNDAGADESQKRMMADGMTRPDMPVMLTEFGGVGFVDGATEQNAWGYADVPKTEEEFKHRYEETLRTVLNFPGLCGYVYTQLTDVEQEINGLLTADRAPKFDVEWLKQVNEGQETE